MVLFKNGCFSFGGGFSPQFYFDMPDKNSILKESCHSDLDKVEAKSNTVAQARRSNCIRLHWFFTDVVGWEELPEKQMAFCLFFLISPFP